MTMKVALQAVKSFREKNHFSDEAWEERGLLPSNPEVIAQLALRLNECTDNVITGLTNEVSEEDLRSILKNGVARFEEDYFDSEEKEYVCELLYELAGYVNLNISNELNSMLYGSGLASLLAQANNREPVETVSQNCTRCAAILETKIMQKLKNVPGSWQIVRCNSCNELNLLTLGPGYKEIRFGNYVNLGTFGMHQHKLEDITKIFQKMKNNG
jgi:hypothetical protein